MASGEARPFASSHRAAAGMEKSEGTGDFKLRPEQTLTERIRPPTLDDLFYRDQLWTFPVNSAL
jgi:hypothetical protein